MHAVRLRFAELETGIGTEGELQPLAQGRQAGSEATAGRLHADAAVRDGGNAAAAIEAQTHVDPPAFLRRIDPVAHRVLDQREEGHRRTFQRLGSGFDIQCPHQSVRHAQLHELEVRAHELQLVRSYLELMQLRMPDRLVWTLDVEPGTESLECPPMALLTLVENAVRHGIDPAEEGGRIDVRLRLDGSRCVASVADSGIGMQPTSGGLGTGLTSLRERLQLAFGADAGLELSEAEPHGVHAMIWFPARNRSSPAAGSVA